MFYIYMCMYVMGRVWRENESMHTQATLAREKGKNKLHEKCQRTVQEFFKDYIYVESYKIAKFDFFYLQTSIFL